MVTCHFNGRLGNQMFQIAAAYSLALDNNDTSAFPIVGLQYQQTIFKKLIPLTAPQAVQVFHEAGFHYTPIPYYHMLLLVGFFQSEKYFVNNRKHILNLFYPDINDIEMLKQKYRFLLVQPTCSLHIRRGDYVMVSNNHPPCDLEYYREAMKCFPPNTQFLIFSDDIPWCKTQFIGNNFHFIEGNSDYVDLYLMTQCEHNIIANSSFSWWGAWLNQNPNKKVIAPSKWFGPGLQHHNTKDLIPETWKII